MKKMILHFLPMILSFLLIAGCSSEKDALQSQVSQLEKEVIRVKEEQSRLRAMAEETRDEMVVVKDKIQRHQEVLNRDGSLTSRLPVVKIQGEEPGAVDPAGTSAGMNVISFKEDEPVIDNTPRPVLRLNEAESRPFRLTDTDIGLGDKDRQNLGVSTLPPLSEPAGAGLSEGKATDPVVRSDFEKAYQLYTQKSYSEALRLFGKVLADAKSPEEGARAFYWRGECLIGQKDYVGAIGENERLLKRYPASEEVPSALYRLGWLYEQLGDMERAKHYYFSVVEKYQDSPAAQRAVSRLKAKGMEVNRQASVSTPGE